MMTDCKTQPLTSGFAVASRSTHGCCRVKKMPPGSAVFETISEEEHTGVIHSLMFHISPVAVSNGVVSFPENGAPAKILYGQHDFKVIHSATATVVHCVSCVMGYGYGLWVTYCVFRVCVRFYVIWSQRSRWHVTSVAWRLNPRLIFPRCQRMCS